MRRGWTVKISIMVESAMALAGRTKVEAPLRLNQVLRRAGATKFTVL
jgi:hypothetical protein